MKKLVGSIVMVSLILSLGATGVSAATNDWNTDAGRRVQTAACLFVDENKDGSCDIHGANCRFTDENGDGVCDNCPNGGVCRMDGTGRKSGHGRGNHHRMTDGNGAGGCANYKSGGCARR